MSATDPNRSLRSASGGRAMTNTFHVGITHSVSLTVDDCLTVPAVSAAFTGFADMPPVFATAYMVGFVEWACIETLRPHPAAGRQTVGTHIDASHAAATPVGMTVTAEVELVAVEGRKLRFAVACRDEAGPIGHGFHERPIIDPPRFLAAVAKKANEVHLLR